MLSIHTLEEGVIYMVTRPFTDYHQNNFTPGAKLTYAGRAFLPYHGGHTLFFKERNIYLQEDDDATLINSLHEYLTSFDATGRVAPTHRPPVLIARGRRKGFYYFVGFFALAMIALLIILFGPSRPAWLPFVPFGIGFLLLIAAVIAEWGHPV
ncbi:MAG: DUF3601 domain-containing protein [Acidobacteria bacterium]|nr:DUF3601 domain-containing protein [Acidobacteriota bacterium]